MGERFSGPEGVGDFEVKEGSNGVFLSGAEDVIGEFWRAFFRGLRSHTNSYRPAFSDDKKCFEVEGGLMDS